MKDKVLLKLKRRGVSWEGLLSLLFATIIMSIVMVASTEAIIPTVNKYRPVVKDFSVRQVFLYVDEKRVVGNAYLHKVQDCYLVPNSIKGYVNIGKEEYPADIEFLSNIDDDEVSRAPTKNVASLGKWQWSGWVPSGEVSGVGFQVSHICDPDISYVLNGTETDKIIEGTVRTTKIGPYNIGELL